MKTITLKRNSAKLLGPFVFKSNDPIKKDEIPKIYRQYNLTPNSIFWISCESCDCCSYLCSQNDGYRTSNCDLEDENFEHLLDICECENSNCPTWDHSNVIIEP